MADEVHTTGNQFAGITPELWAAAFYPTLLERMAFQGSIARQYEGVISNLGNTVNINDFPQFDEADEVLEDERADADSTSANTQQLVINKRVVKDFIISSNAEIQSLEAENALRDLAMHAIMKKMQNIIITETVPSASSPDHQIPYDSGTTLALADILEAKELLDDSNVEELGRTMIVGSAQQNDLFNITGFTSRDFIPAGSPLTSGAIVTPIMGFEFKWTTEVGNTSYFFHPLYMTMAVQETPSVNMYDLGVDGKRAKRVNMDVLFGVKQLSNLRVVEVA